MSFRVNFLKNILLTNLQVRVSQKSYSIKSRLPNTPIPKTTFDHYIWKNLDKWHDKTAIECFESGKSFTYFELYKNSRVLAHFLHKHPSIEQGDTVAIILPNVPEYPIIFMAITQAGFKVTTVNPLHNSEEIEKQLTNSHAKFIFTSSQLCSKITQALKSRTIPTPIVALRNDASKLQLKPVIATLKGQKNLISEDFPAGVTKLSEIFESKQELDVHFGQNEDDEVLLPYSSGTTGFPKTILLTNKNFTATMHNMEATGFQMQRKTVGNDQDTVLVMLPMFHIYGLVLCLMNALSTGTKIVAVPKFSTNVLIKGLERYDQSLLFLVPPLVHLLNNNPQITYNHISKVKTIVSGAAPLRSEDVEKLQEKSRGNIKLFQAYGLSEAFGMVTHQNQAIPNGVKLGGSGLVIPNMECKIVSIEDENEIELGPNQSGEILVRGSQVMKGYYNDVEANQNAFNSEGWLRTGDIGYYDEDEQFFITDRIKDLIKVKGFQVAPAEIEAILRTHPDVEDAAVIGVPHPILGEVPKAFIVSKSKTSKDGLDIQEYVANKVSNYKQILGGIVTVDNIPKNPSGKILKKQLRQLN